MDDIGPRLSALLTEVVPDPPRRITADEIRGLGTAAQVTRTRSSRRWQLPLLAGAAVALVAAVATTVALVNSGGQSTPSRPAGPVSSSSPAPSSTPSDTASPSTSPSTSPSINSGVGPARPNPDTTCSSTQLTLSQGASDGAAGTIRTEFRLGNNGPSSCTMQGFPGVSLLDGNGNIVGQPASRTGAAGATITVRAQGYATFTIAISDVTQTGCDTPRPSTQIQVYPPNQTVALRIPFATAACSLTVTTTSLG